MNTGRSQDPYEVDLVDCILRSHRRLTGRPLLPARSGEPVEEAARRLHESPLVVLAHDTSPDPLFTYANLAAQRLFERPWDELVGLPSRLSAEAPAREERERLLLRVAEQGFIEDYSGVRIARSGRRFRILRATVWNLLAADGTALGQAAAFADWEPCP